MLTIESEIVTVVFFSTTEITEITRLKKKSSGLDTLKTSTIIKQDKVILAGKQYLKSLKNCNQGIPTLKIGLFQIELSWLTLSQTTILHFSELKEFADKTFKFDENARKLSKWVENTVGNGENARYEQFLLLPQCFRETYTADT